MNVDSFIDKLLKLGFREARFTSGYRVYFSNGFYLGYTKEDKKVRYSSVTMSKFENKVVESFDEFKKFYLEYLETKLDNKMIDKRNIDKEINEMKESIKKLKGM